MPSLTRYVVAITTRKGPTRYLQLIPATEGGIDTKLVLQKYRARTFESPIVADLVSDWFWDHHWKHKEYGTRYIDTIHIRRKGKQPHA